MQTMCATHLRKKLFDTLARIAENREPVEITIDNRSIAALVPSTGLPPTRRKPLLDLDAISAFCRKHQVKSFALFGSILRDDFNEESDVDVLLDVDGRSLEFHESCSMIDELETMFGRKVDMATDSDLKRANRYRRESIQSASQEIYRVTA